MKISNSCSICNKYPQERILIKFIYVSIVLNFSKKQSNMIIKWRKRKRKRKRENKEEKINIMKSNLFHNLIVMRIE